MRRPRSSPTTCAGSSTAGRSPPAPSAGPRGSGGPAVVTADGNGVAKLWSASDPTADPRELHHDAAVSLADFSRDGTILVTADANGFVRRWDARTAAPRGLAMKHDRPVLHASF